MTMQQSSNSWASLGPGCYPDQAYDSKADLSLPERIRRCCLYTGIALARSQR